MALIGGGKINTHPCTPEEMSQNLVQIQNDINYFYEISNEGGDADTFKVLVNGSDAAPNYLHAKIDQSETPPAYSAPVKSQTIGNLTEAFYWDAQDITGWADDQSYFMVLDGGSPSWQVASLGAVDTFKVSSTSFDSTPNYLHDAFTLAVTGEYVGDADFQVASQTVGVQSTNQTERLFVDISTIRNWAATGTLVLAIVDNVSQYLPIDDIPIPDGVASVELITFMYPDAISAATKVGGGPTILPTIITGEVMELLESGKLELTGEMVDVEYRDGVEVPDPGDGYVLIGEALRIGTATPVVLNIYCKAWDES